MHNLTLSQYLHWCNTVRTIIFSHLHLCRKTRSYLLLLLLYLCPHLSSPVIAIFQLLSHVWFSMTPWNSARQAFLSFTLPEIAQTHVHWVSDAIQPSPPLSSPTPPASIFPSIRVFSSGSVLWSGGPSIGVSALASVLPMNIRRLISLRMDWLDLPAVQGTLKSLLQHHSSTHQFFSAQLSLWSNTHIHTWYWKNHSFDYTDLLSAR